MQINDKVLESLKSIASFLPHLFSLAWKTVIVLGGVVLVAYCYFENILPDGLSTGDVFFLASAAFSIASIAIVGFGYGAFAGLWLIRLMVFLQTRHRARRGLDASSTLHKAISDKFLTVMSFLVAMPFILLIFFAHAAPDVHFRGTLGFFMAVGGFATLMFGVLPVAAQRRSLRLTFGVCTIAAFGILVATRPAILNLAMVNLGVRSNPGELILVSDAAHTQLAAAAKVSDIQIGFCSIPESNQWGTRDVRVVWHGIGSSSYVRLLDESSNGIKNVLVRVDRTTINPLRGENVVFKCNPIATKTGS